jgi:hypothetical protein
MNPATFLRALGPEPWSVCYPEPSVRPDDSRYGANPNRVQRHTQFQVGGHTNHLARHTMPSTCMQRCTGVEAVWLAR